MTVLATSYLSSLECLCSLSVIRFLDEGKWRFLAASSTLQAIIPGVRLCQCFISDGFIASTSYSFAKVFCMWSEHKCLGFFVPDGDLNKRNTYLTFLVTYTITLLLQHQAKLHPLGAETTMVVL